MAASYEDISEWFDKGVGMGATHMIVICDTYDHSDYPLYVMKGTKKIVEKKIKANSHSHTMQRVMEVYDLHMDKEAQMNQHRCWSI